MDIDDHRHTKEESETLRDMVSHIRDSLPQLTEPFLTVMNERDAAIAESQELRRRLNFIAAENHPESISNDIPDTDWKAVTRIFNAIIEEATSPTLADEETSLQLRIYSPALDETLHVTVPTRKVEDFMKHLPLFQAYTYSGEQFCNSCGGPFGGWLKQYGGHWDTCPNRKN